MGLRILRRRLGSALAAWVCVWAHVALAGAQTVAPAQLYFALELRHDGKVVGTPKLLGEPGKWVRAERRSPGATRVDYRLSLLPEEVAGGYRVELSLELPETRGRNDAISLSHGEERQLELGSKPGELQVNMLLMRVDSPEFEALMRLSTGEEGNAPDTI